MRAILALAVLLAQTAAERPRLSPEIFRGRRAALAARFPGETLVLDAGPLKEPGDDANAPVLDFKYLTGFHDPEGRLVLREGRGVVFTDDPAGAGWGIEEVHETARFPTWAAEHLAGSPKLLVKLRPPSLEALRKAAPGAELVDGPLRDALVRMRLLKSADEVRCHRVAAAATAAAFRQIARRLRPGRNEHEIQEVVREAFRANGCPEVAYPPILGAGRNGTILHYMDNNRQIPEGTLLLCDIGASFENYAADITRTFPVSGRFSPSQRLHYQAVLDALKAAERVLRPGANFGTLDRAARAVFEERGLVKWSYAHSRDFSVRHGIGHYVGMNVHDSGTYRERFEPGMVVTIEPGWYDKDAGYGIRIEDFYLVTESGFERLSSETPREADDVERLMRREDY